MSRVVIRKVRKQPSDNEAYIIEREPESLGDRLDRIEGLCKTFMEREYTTGYGFAADVLRLVREEIAERRGCRHTFVKNGKGDVCVACGDQRG